jgi:hypothetical protein
LAAAFAFVICTEAAIEAQSRLLVRSIRRFGGRFAAAPILSYAPRPGHEPSAACSAELSALGVTLMPDRLNLQWPDYPLANKPLAAAHAEAANAADTLAFLDSDQVVLDEPAEFALDAAAEIALRPAFHRNIGLASPDDPHAAFWSQLHASLGARPKRKVMATCDFQVIDEYYNSGLIAVRRERGLFQAWRCAFEIAMAAPPAEPNDAYYVEQAALAAAITWKADAPTILPPQYNLPIHWPCLQRNRVVHNLDRAVSLHYGDTFGDGGWRDVLALWNGKLRTDRVAWLAENLVDLAF